MVSNIDKDDKRFTDIRKRKVRENLGKLINRGDIKVVKGKRVVSVPVYGLDIPRFRFGQGQQQGMGEGDGEEGDAIGEGDASGIPQKAGEDPAEHELEVEVELEELARMLGEELELPNIKPKGKKNIYKTIDEYKNLRRHGPQGMMNFRHTWFNALKRQMATGNYDPRHPNITIIPDDMRFRSWKTKELPECNAVIIYLMDVSGSMGDDQKNIARRTSFWLDLWIRDQYKGVESVYVTHDAEAREVDRHTFYHTRETGGTMISSGYDVINKIISERYNPSDWNIYLFQYSDGDNWSALDTQHCFQIMGEMVDKLNLVGYVQIESPYGSGDYLNDIEEFRILNDLEDKIITSEIGLSGAKDESIMEAIRRLLSTGR